MGKDFTVTIHHPQRRIEWLEMFGTTSIHVKSIFPEIAVVLGFDDPQPVYYVDLECLTPQQQMRLIRHLAMRLSLSIEQVKNQLREDDVPIPAMDCILTVKNPHKWLR